MSNIKKRFEEFMIMQSSQQAVKDTRTPVNVRVDSLTLFCIEKLMKEIEGSSRAGVCNEIIAAGVWDALEPFGISYEDIQEEYMEEIKKRHAEEGK